MLARYIVPRGLPRQTGILRSQLFVGPIEASPPSFPFVSPAPLVEKKNQYGRGLDVPVIQYERIYNAKEYGLFSGSGMSVQAGLPASTLSLQTPRKRARDL